MHLVKAPADGHNQIQEAAEDAGMDPQAFCDMNYRTFEVGIPQTLVWD